MSSSSSSNGVAVWVSSEALFSTLRNASTTAATETAFIGRTTGGRSRRIGLGRTTFNNDGAVCSAKEGKREGNRAGSPPAYLPPSIHPTHAKCSPSRKVVVWPVAGEREKGEGGQFGSCLADSCDTLRPQRSFKAPFSDKLA